ncbi:SMP-30/gluconolactonase/LRE family protein [Halovulum sp. GXIMD14794]
MNSDTPFELVCQPQAITGESPVWDDRRNCLWWIDIQAQRLLRTEADGATCVTFLPWQPGFVALAESGRLVLGLENGLHAYSPETEEWEQISDTEADRPTVRLNDGKPDGRGRLWFGSMDMTGTGQAIGRLYRRDPDGNVTVEREGITVPNAIVPGSDDSLLFADSPTGLLERYRVGPDGALSEPDVILELPSGVHPDGAVLDSEGAYWVGLIGPSQVWRVSRSGEILARVATPVSRVTMPALGGPEGDRFYITSQRRFLPVDRLRAEPNAGGLLMAPGIGRAGPVYRVAGV